MNFCAAAFLQCQDTRPHLWHQRMPSYGSCAYSYGNVVYCITHQDKIIMLTQCGAGIVDYPGIDKIICKGIIFFNTIFIPTSYLHIHHFKISWNHYIPVSTAY
jgi:hypothetical protein